MKKLLLVGAMALFGAMNAQENGFRVGAHVGLPIGDAGDISNFNAGVDVAYVWSVGDGLEVGLTTGYSHYFGKEYTISGGGFFPDITTKLNFGVVPIAATGQYTFNGDQGFNIGADLGYGFFTGDAEDGGLYYQPKIGYSFGENQNVYVGYKSINNDGDISSINLGYTMKF